MICDNVESVVFWPAFSMRAKVDCEIPSLRAKARCDISALLRLIFVAKRLAILLILFDPYVTQGIDFALECDSYVNHSNMEPSCKHLGKPLVIKFVWRELCAGGRGEVSPEIDTVEKIATALGLKLWQLFKGDITHLTGDT